MSVKASISMPEQQEAFARGLVERGRYTSMSAVVQQGLDLLCEQTEMKDAERTLLKAPVEERATGEFALMLAVFFGGQDHGVRMLTRSSSWP